MARSPPSRRRSRSHHHSDEHTPSANDRPLFVSVRETVIAAEPSLREAIKWRDCLTYESSRNVIQTVVGKGKISLIFFDGIEINDEAGLLEGEGKGVRTMRITSEMFDKQALRSYVEQAVRLSRS